MVYFIPTYVLAVLCVLVDVMRHILQDEKGFPGLMWNVTVTEIVMIKPDLLYLRAFTKNLLFFISISDDWFQESFNPKYVQG